MNKQLYLKMLQAVKQGKDLKQTFTKEEIKQFMIQQAISLAIKAITPFLGYIAIAVLIIGVLLAAAMVIFQVVSGFWPQLSYAWGYLWGGTTSSVNDDNVSILYYDLLQQGVDFETIGAVGEHTFIEKGFLSKGLESIIDDPQLRKKVEEKLNTNNLREQYSLQYWLDNVTDDDLQYVKVNQSKLDYINNDDPDKELSDVVEMDYKLDKNGNRVLETKEEAASRLLSQKLVIYNNNNVGKDEYSHLKQIKSDETIGRYLKRYIMAEEETFSIRNQKTFAGAGFQGGVHIQGVNDEGLTWWDFNLYGAIGNIIDMMGTPVTAHKISAIDENFYAQLEITKSVVHHTDILSGTSVSFKDLVKEEKVLHNFNVTEEMQNYAMPWQYPFAFHQHTLCPDVGYEVALMAHKYHTLNFDLVNTESGLVKVFSENGSQRFSEPLRAPQLYVTQISTWYDTEKYDYANDINSGWHGVAQGHAKNYNEIQGMNINTESEWVEKTAVLIERVETEYDHSSSCHSTDVSHSASIKYWSVNEPAPKAYTDSYTIDGCGEHTHTSTSTDSEGNTTTTTITHNCSTIYVTEYHTYEKLYIVEGTYEYQDNPTITIEDTMAKQEQVKLTGVEAMKQLLLPDPEFDVETQTISNYEQAAKYYRANDLAIKQATDGSTYTKDLLHISTSAEAIIKSLYDMYNKVEYNYEGVSIDEIDSVVSAEDSPNAYLSLENNIPIVVDLIQFFASNDVIDSSLVVGLSQANSFAVMAQWFIAGDQATITSSGNIANIITGVGKEVSAPVTGVLSKVDGTNYISIKTDKLGTVYLSNIELDSSIILGRTVSKGQKIGVTTGNVSYYRVDDAGQEVTSPAQELKQLQTAEFSEYAWPVPDSANITSRFGTRTDPITGKTSRHNGVDIGAAQGSPIVAYMDGEIYKAAYDPDGYGYYIIIKHSENCYTLYGHMSAFAVRSGTVNKGQVIGYVGSTGRSTGPHLHFEYRTGPNYNDGIEPLSKLSNYTTY